jgi:hypothetical protein
MPWKIPSGAIYLVMLMLPQLRTDSSPLIVVISKVALDPQRILTAAKADRAPCLTEVRDAAHAAARGCDFKAPTEHPNSLAISHRLANFLLQAEAYIVSWQGLSKHESMLPEA